MKSIAVGASGSEPIRVWPKPAGSWMLALVPPNDSIGASPVIGLVDGVDVVEADVVVGDLGPAHLVGEREATLRACCPGAAGRRPRRDRGVEHRLRPVPGCSACHGPCRRSGALELNREEDVPPGREPSRSPVSAITLSGPALALSLATTLTVPSAEVRASTEIHGRSDPAGRPPFPCLRHGRSEGCSTPEVHLGGMRAGACRAAPRCPGSPPSPVIDLDLVVRPEDSCHGRSNLLRLSAADVKVTVRRCRVAAGFHLAAGSGTAPLSTYPGPIAPPCANIACSATIYARIQPAARAYAALKRVLGAAVRDRPGGLPAGLGPRIHRMQ